MVRTGTKPASDAAYALVDRHLDRSYLVDTLVRLAQQDTVVPLGFETLIEPDHPKLVHYVQKVLRPELVRIGMHDLLDVPRNNVVVQVGRRGGRTLLIQGYTPTQHFNLMKDPFSGRVANARAYGVDEPAVFGQGMSQNKAHHAAMLTVLRLIRESGVTLNGMLYWAINNEGRSTHDCTTAILAALQDRPDFAIVQLGTGLRISIGNRGRVDVRIHVRGKPAHSSSPHEGLSAIEGANEVLARIRTLAWPDPHPQLGRRQAVPYLMRYEPVAPHTLPSDAYITVDRRMLPGDDPDAATDEIRRAIGDLSPFTVTVTRGVHMLPNLLDPSDPWLRSFRISTEAVSGREHETFYSVACFDAGGTSSVGIPTIMYGVTGGKIWPIAEDFVPISGAETEARVLAHFILTQLG